MRRVLFARGRIRLWSHPTMLYLGMIVGTIAQTSASKVAHQPADRVWLTTMLIVPVALAGARLLYVATHWEVYSREPRRIWRDPPNGGYAMYGGLPCMLLASIPILHWTGVSFWSFWDSAVFFVFPAMMLTRIGCLLDGCCMGRTSTGRWALTLRDRSGHTTRRVPSQLLEGYLAGILLIGAALVWRHLPGTGELFLLSLAGYALGRLALQPTRAVRQWMGGLDLQQAISAGVATLAIAALPLARM